MFRVNNNDTAFFTKTMEFATVVWHLGYGMGGMNFPFRTCPSPSEVERALNERDLPKITHMIFTLWNLGYRDIKPGKALEVVDLALQSSLTDKPYHRFGLFKHKSSCKTKLIELQNYLAQELTREQKVDQIRSDWEVTTRAP